MNESLKFAPALLTAEQRQDLHGVLDDFFRNFHLQDIREILWDWLVAALSSEAGAYNSGYARSNLIFVYEKLHLLIEAVHEINTLRKKQRKWKNRKWITKQ